MKCKHLLFLLIACLVTIVPVESIADSVMNPFIEEVNKAEIEEEQSLVPFSDSVAPFTITSESISGSESVQQPPTSRDGNQNSNRILEDLIDVQKKYQMLKDQWNKIQDQKQEVIMNTSTTTVLPSTSAFSTTTVSSIPSLPSLSSSLPSTSSSTIKQYEATTKSAGTNEIEEVDIDVFEDRERFMDISNSDESNSLNFDDISATTRPKSASDELSEIESAIIGVLGKDGTTIKPEPVPPTAMISVILGKQNGVERGIRPAETKNSETEAPPTLFEIIGPRTTKSVARGVPQTEIKMTTTTTAQSPMTTTERSTESPIDITIEPIFIESTTSANDYDEVKPEDKPKPVEPEEEEVEEDDDEISSLEDNSMEEHSDSLLNSFSIDAEPVRQPVRVEPTPRHFEVRPIGFEHQVPPNVATAWRRKLESMPAEEGVSDPFDPEMRLRSSRVNENLPPPRSKVFRKITRRIITKSRSKPEEFSRGLEVPVTTEQTTVSTSTSTSTSTTTTTTTTPTTPTTTTTVPTTTTTPTTPSTTTTTPTTPPSTTPEIFSTLSFPTTIVSSASPIFAFQQDPAQTQKPTTIFSLPHGLQQSSFISSGKDVDALPATKRFKFPNHVQIPFYGAKTQELPVATTTMMTTTTTVQTPQSFEIKKENNVEETMMTLVNEDADSASVETSDSDSGLLPSANENKIPEAFQGGFGGSFGSKRGPSDIPEFSFSLPEPVGIKSEEKASTTSSSPIAVTQTPTDQFGREPPQTFGSKRGPSEFPFDESVSKGVGTFGTKLAPSDEALGKEDFTFGNRKTNTKDEQTLIPFNLIQEKSHTPVHENSDILKEEIAKLPTVYHPTPVLNTNSDNKNTIGILMQKPKNPYIQRTTMSPADVHFETPIGPHGLQEPTASSGFPDINLETTKAKISSVEMLLPAWGLPDSKSKANKKNEDKKKTKKSVNNGILTEARRQYQNEFEQQVRDFKMINEEIGKISREAHIQNPNQNPAATKCEPIYAQPLSVAQLRQMSHSLGFMDLSKTIEQAADTTLIVDDNLETRLDEKRRLVSKIELLLSLAESRHSIHELLVQQKKLEQALENAALEMIDNANFHPNAPSSITDIDELSSAVQSVLGNEIENNFMNSSPDMAGGKKKSNLQETAEIVEPVLAKTKSQSRKNLKMEKSTTKLNFTPQAQNDQFGRKPKPDTGRAIQGFKMNRRPSHPIAPPTMSPEEIQFFNPAQMAAPRQKNVAPIRPPFRPPTDDELTDKNESPSSVHDLLDLLHEDISNIPADHEACEQVKCDFESADLCNFESSHDETTRRRRSRRSSEDLLDDPPIADDLLPYTFRAWSIWAGRRAEQQKQIDIGPEFSRHNTHFAAIFLEPEQAGILSAPLVLTGKKTIIRMKIFEGTRGIRLRVCCDRYCPLETEEGVYRGHRFWLRKTITCPANTQMISFECLNEGKERGACGVDDIFMESSNCRQLFTGVDQN